MNLSFNPPHIYTVSSLTSEIKSLIENGFDFIWVEGEISNFVSPVSGHYYMSLKDKNAQIKAVMFRIQANYLKFMPEDGMRVIARGRIGVYEPRGEYQIILDYVEPLGVGELAAAYEQTKKKLALEGVFDEEKKRPIPFMPKKIAVITSPTGAAIRDFLRISLRRMPNLHIFIVPVRVQGDEAVGDIVEALEIANRELDVDVIVLTRGGGSFEDLWPFNREEVAYAIRRSIFPVVSAVGHEIDMTISDMASDLRAPTPSGAAELIIPQKDSIERELSLLSSRLQTSFNRQVRLMKGRAKDLSSRIKDPRRHLADTWLMFDDVYSRLYKLGQACIHKKRVDLKSSMDMLISNSPMHSVRLDRQELDSFSHSLAQAIKNNLYKMSSKLGAIGNKLDSLNPLSILDRGYSITRRLPEMNIIKNAEDVKIGDSINVLLSKGTIEGTVKNTVKN
ncbi:MAG: exodeoxyribonuclease VII large subunit [Deltaproteobacteria bacterium]|nr:exodeoxyribonuclease VII large subunit [Deltaproteobacteria bacterium]